MLYCEHPWISNNNDIEQMEVRCPRMGVAKAVSLSHYLLFLSIILTLFAPWTATLYFINVTAGDISYMNFIQWI